MAEGYGSVASTASQGVGRSQPLRRRLVSHLALAAGVAVIVIGTATFLHSSRPRRMVLVEELPSAVQDLQSFVNMDEKKGWVNDAFSNAQNHQALHPLGNLDPFTHQPVAADDYESMLRAHKTKAITDQIQSEANAEIADAQQSARDFVGTDAGCTHQQLDQQDYSGDVASTVTGRACDTWAHAYENLTYAESFDPAIWTTLTDNYCRNPGGGRIGSWCYLTGLSGLEPDVEGTTWEYCDIGKRCKQDMPLLHAKHAAKLKPAQTQNAKPALKPVTGQVLARKGKVATGLVHYTLGRKQGRTEHQRPVIQQQQLAYVGNDLQEPLYKWDHGISTKAARSELKRDDWFMLDRSRPRVVDTGMEQGLSSAAARQSLDSIWK